GFITSRITRLKRSSLNIFNAFFPSVAVDTRYPSISRLSLMASSKCSSSSTNKIRCFACCMMVLNLDKYLMDSLFVLQGAYLRKSPQPSWPCSEKQLQTHFPKGYCLLRQFVRDVFQVPSLQYITLTLFLSFYGYLHCPRGKTY